MDESEFADIKLSDGTAVASIQLHVVDGHAFITYKEDPEKVQPTRLQVVKMLHLLANQMLDTLSKSELEDRH